jgi:hypothetical protein
MFSSVDIKGDATVNQPPIPPESLDPVIKRQLETSLHGQYAFAAKTVWMSWIFNLAAVALALVMAWSACDSWGRGFLPGTIGFSLATIVCILVGYAMWASHQVQKKLSKQHLTDMAERSQN